MPEVTARRSGHLTHGAVVNSHHDAVNRSRRPPDSHVADEHDALIAELP
jgi:hypothetical protein